MCGLVGFFEGKKHDAGHLESVVTRMALAIQHRGPDDAGAWVDAQAGIALGHRRLSIVDLSAAGHQPMLSASGRFVLIFNGEVYNHLEMRGELEGNAVDTAIRQQMDRNLGTMDGMDYRHPLYLDSVFYKRHNPRLIIGREMEKS